MLHFRHTTPVECMSRVDDVVEGSDDLFHRCARVVSAVATEVVIGVKTPFQRGEGMPLIPVGQDHIEVVELHTLEGSSYAFYDVLARKSGQ